MRKWQTRAVAAGKVYKCGLGICNLLRSGRWLLNSARCKGCKCSFLSSRTCLGLSDRFSLQRTHLGEDVSAHMGKFHVLFCSITGKFVEAPLWTDPAWFGCTHFHPLSTNVGFSFSCDTFSCQPTARLSLSAISCRAVRTRLLNFYIRLLNFHAND